MIIITGFQRRPENYVAGITPPYIIWHPRSTSTLTFSFLVKSSHGCAKKISIYTIPNRITEEYIDQEQKLKNPRNKKRFARTVRHFMRTGLHATPSHIPSNSNLISYLKKLLRAKKFQYSWVQEVLAVSIRDYSPLIVVSDNWRSVIGNPSRAWRIFWESTSASITGTVSSHPWITSSSLAHG